jgi:hypothetical protein
MLELLAIVVPVFVIGFLAGYGTRALRSHHRRTQRWS